MLAAVLIFLSYARVDRVQADQIHRSLERSGCKVWHDVNSLHAGDRWGRKVEQAIDRADVVLVLIGTPCNVCRDEQARAKRRGRRIVPLLLWPSADIPLILEELNRIEEKDVGVLCGGK